MNSFKSKATRIAVIVVVVISSIFYSFKSSNEFKILKSLDIFYSIFRELMFFYVDDIDPEKAIDAGIEGLLSSLDPYTSYVPAEEKKNFRFLTTGEYGGIGAYVRRNDTAVIISEPHKNFPADKAGLRAGDIILEIDDKPVKQTDLRDVSEMLKGIPSTTVKIKICRPFIDSVFSVSIAREKISIKSVSYYNLVRGTVGYIRLERFTQDASKEVKEAFVYLRDKRGATSVILDLRGNPGGLLNEAVDIVNLFVKKNTLIVETRGKVEKYNASYKTTMEAVDTLIPLVILVNGSSASASEIIAGTMQDLDRAVVVGEKTYGKGLVQSTRSLSYEAQLKVTTARYYIPSGRCIQAIDYSDKAAKKITATDTAKRKFTTRNGRLVYDAGGIMPDVVVESEEMARITYKLFNEQHIFDFSTYFRVHNDTIAKPSLFTLREEDYADFKSFLEKRGFSYRTASEEKLESLIETIKEEKYFERTEATLQELKKKLEHDKNNDLDQHKDMIMQLLREEIVSRYYYNEGRLAVALTADPQIERAIEVLTDKETYAGILSGKKKYGNII